MLISLMTPPRTTDIRFGYAGKQKIDRTIRYYDNRFDPRPAYPNSWCGEARLEIKAFLTEVRFSLSGRTCENDVEHVDGYKLINISPRCARWFAFYTYPRARRTMWHLFIGKFGVSYIPHEYFV